MLSEIADGQSAAFQPPPCERCELAREELYERRLAGAVRTQQTQAVSRSQSDVDAVEHRPPRISRAHALQREQRVRRTGGLRKFEMERRIHVRRRDLLHAIE